MAHAIRSYVKGQLVEVLLPVYTGVRQVRAALIISLGLGPNPGETRLALTGGAHVDVTKAWMQKNAPQAGRHYFVQDGEGNGVAHPAEAFEGEFADQATPPAPGGAGTDPEPPASGPEVVEGKGIPVTGTIGKAPAVTETVDSTGSGRIERRPGWPAQRRGSRRGGRTPEGGRRHQQPGRRSRFR